MQFFGHGIAELRKIARLRKRYQFLGDGDDNEVLNFDAGLDMVRSVTAQG